MAEACKKEVGCVKIPIEQKTFKVKGRDAVSGLPRFVEVGYSDMKPVVKEIADDIVNAIKDLLEKTPPELIGDIHSDGIILTGGLAKLTGLAKMISETTKLKVRVHKEASDCVIMGCGKAIKYINDFENPRKNSISPFLEAY